MSNSPFPSPAPGFDDPLGVLRACHERIQSHCKILIQLAERLGKEPRGDEVYAAARKVHRYFSTEAVVHHRDEEEELFPRLVRESLKLAEVIHHLKQDHHRIAKLWSELSPLLERPHQITDITHFQQNAQALSELYLQHMRTEERDFFNVAQHILSDAELRKIGRSMKERRGLQ